MTTPQTDPALIREQRLRLREERLARQPVPGGGPQEPPAPGGAAPAPAPAGGTGLSARWGPLPAWAWILIIAGVGLAGILLWRAHKNAAATAATTAPSTAASTTASDGTSSEDNCTDSSGNSVPCDQADYAAQIAALQAEIANLQGEVSAYLPGGGTGTAGTTGTTGATGTGTVTQLPGGGSGPPPKGGVLPIYTPAVAVPSQPATGASAAAPAK